MTLVQISLAELIRLFTQITDTKITPYDTKSMVLQAYELRIVDERLDGFDFNV